MEAVFNLLVVAIVALIAYWWSSQGFVSGFLHLVCVICAGAFALALWEPLIYDFVHTGSWWDQLLPGVMLLLTFAVALLLMRMVTDRLAPDHVNVPQTVDMIGGAGCGAAAGVLTVGLLLIGTGFIQRPLIFMGYQGWARLDNGVVSAPESSLWVPVDRITASFYEFLSVSTLYPDVGGQPMAIWAPHLDRQATLLRDTGHTSKNKSGQLMQPPGSVTVDRPVAWYPDEEGGYYLTIPLDFKRTGLDFERVLMLSSSQARLVGDLADGSTATYHPVAWRQAIDKDDTSGFYRFDAPSRYASNVNGIDKANIKLVFALPESFQPRFIQVRNLRLMLEEADQTEGMEEYFTRTGATGAGINDGWGGVITELVDLRGRFHRTIRPTIDDFSGSFDIDRGAKKLAKASFAKVKKSRKSGRGATAVNGYLAPEDAVVVRINVSPGSGASIMAVARELGGDGALALLDDQNKTYEPVGYEMIGDRGATISFNETIQKLSDIRARPRAGTDDLLYLIFVVPEGIRPVELMMDDLTVGYIEGVTVKSKR